MLQYSHTCDGLKKEEEKSFFINSIFKTKEIERRSQFPAPAVINVYLTLRYHRMILDGF